MKIIKIVEGWFMGKFVDSLWEKYGSEKEKEVFLEELRGYFVQKEKLYDIGKNSKDLAKKHIGKVEESIEIANNILRDTFLFRNKWDMEKTNIPYTFDKGIKWDMVANGDLEWCYMLNRHRHFEHLGISYEYTEDRRYLYKFEELIESFIEDEHDKNLTWRSIEVGIRLDNWIRALEYFLPDIKLSIFEKILDSLYEQGLYINQKKNFFTYTSNWGLLEYHGLFILAIYLKRFEETRNFLDDSLKVIEKCLNNQILQDGSQWEQSPLYHNEILKLVLNIIYLCEKSSIKIPKVILDKGEKMVEANLKWLKPNGYFPLIGDSDNLDTKDIMAMATFIFGKKEYRYYAYDKVDYQLDKLYDDEQIIWYENLKGIKKEKSEYLKDMGVVISRGKESHVNFYLHSLGGGHSHDDILHFSFYANNRDYLVDNGRYTYVNSVEREYFKSSLKHNSFMVDGYGLNEYKDSWSNEYESQVFGKEVEFGEKIDYFEGSTLAFTRLKDPVIGKRKILHLKEESIVILIDYFKSKEKHKYQLNFNFAPMNIDIGEEKAIFDNFILTNLDNVEMKLVDTFYSPEYNKRVESKRIELHKESKGEVFITCIHNDKVKNIEYVEVRDRLGMKVEKNIALALRINFDSYSYLVFVRENMQKETSFFRLGDEFYIDKYRVEKVDGDGKDIIK